MNSIGQHVVGDVFRIYDRELDSYRNVVLARIAITQKHFYLLSMHSFEPWNERTVSTKDMFGKTTLDMGEIEYLADTADVTYVGNMYHFKKEIDDVFMARTAR
ncbi:hypothetical protein [Limisalsivibrio acetivorans]|uniref:hypothetical protein n=1 Tax=Limisalsivibrio acetivorans TaxID=1304888 RepID=UPI0003B3F114|nr:hypothetical protein [Limisalsivibrio acetivorans]